MCVPGCQETVARRLFARRRFLKSAGAAVGLAMVGCAPEPMTEPQAAARQVTFSRVVDLTHPLGTDFPSFAGTPFLEIEVLGTLEADGYNINRWHLTEHYGTHMDAPFHFSDQDTADMIPVENLVLPLAVIDIRAKAAADADAQLTPDDLRAWEAEHGPLPDRACVAMYSGWDVRVPGDGFRNADAEGMMHFPGFHVEAAHFLLEERNVLALAVDTLSLDHGPSPDFATHYAWLPTNRWGMECVANLGEVPPVGATIVAGGPKIVGATGGPSRVLALV